MNYEIVTLEEKMVVGLEARTNNASPEMGSVIGGLWQQFYSAEVYPKIEHKANNHAVGIYTDYASDEKGDYTVVVACEVEMKDTLPEGMVARTIPAGRYARFLVEGDMQQAVAEFWSKLWQLDLPRNYVCDFEEYLNSDPVHAKIYVYIGLCAEK
ncbi:GyrI-like domain-containing protein [Anaerosporobacter faecicola]|uniref:GyrI-like domain-containing protein n=1 Tax=Anaerosporobacter faecicola TaxID=2718714 RepID=UPI00143C8B83|nr:GyrI-like domain-containing protein [Anaerosporobacter faecicola]